jgi:hypothetical protein
MSILNKKRKGELLTISLGVAITAVMASISVSTTWGAVQSLAGTSGSAGAKIEAKNVWTDMKTVCRRRGTVERSDTADLSGAVGSDTPKINVTGDRSITFNGELLGTLPSADDLTCNADIEGCTGGAFTGGAYNVTGTEEDNNVYEINLNCVEER